jgi:hypothetical protein
MTETRTQSARDAVDAALRQARAADLALIDAALRLLCLDLRESHPEAAAIEFEWSDQGPFLTAAAAYDAAGDRLDWEDIDSVAWNLDESNAAAWMPRTAARPEGCTHEAASGYRLDVDQTLDGS